MKNGKWKINWNEQRHRQGPGHCMAMQRANWTTSSGPLFNQFESIQSASWWAPRNWAFPIRFQSIFNPFSIHFQSIFNPFSIHFQWNAIESDNNGNWRNKNMNQSAIERRHGNQRPIKTWESLNKRSIISVSIQLESIHSFIRPDEIKAQRKWQPFSTIRINLIDGKIHHHHQLDQSVFQKKNMARKW